MSSLFSNLTAAALVVHAIMGCCWHHAHVCQHALTMAGHADDAEACRGSECDEHSRQPEPAGDDRHSDDGCQGPPCSFVATQSNATVLQLLGEHEDLAAVAAPIAARQPEVCCRRESLSLSAGDCLAVRLHLLNQVFLI